jgi:hypothetical protein
MGTRSLTVFIDEWSQKEIVVMYRQFDGYPQGHGQELAEFLLGFNIVNGLSDGQGSKVANGMGCLAAQTVTHFKSQEGAGGIYLRTAETRNAGEEYVYIVSAVGNVPHLAIYEVEYDWTSVNGDYSKSVPRQEVLIMEGNPESILEKILALD